VNSRVYISEKGRCNLRTPDCTGVLESSSRDRLMGLRSTLASTLRNLFHLCSDETLIPANNTLWTLGTSYSRHDVLRICCRLTELFHALWGWRVSVESPLVWAIRLHSAALLASLACAAASRLEGRGGNMDNHFHCDNHLCT